MCENSAQQKCNSRKENGLQLGAINQRHIKQLQLLPIDEETNLLQLTNEEFEQQSLLDVIDNSIKELREQFGLLVTETEDNIYQYDIYKLKLEAAEKYLFLLQSKATTSTTASPTAATSNATAAAARIDCHFA